MLNIFVYPNIGLKFIMFLWFHVKQIISFSVHKPGLGTGEVNVQLSKRATTDLKQITLKIRELLQPILTNPYL